MKETHDIRKSPAYLQIFVALYVWSGNWELDGQRSLFSATLYLSALNLLNLLTLIFIGDVLGTSVDITRAWAIAAPVAIFIMNFAYARAHQDQLPQWQSYGTPRQGYRLAQAYLAISGLAFVSATTLFVLTGPAAV